MSHTWLSSGSDEDLPSLAELLARATPSNPRAPASTTAKSTAHPLAHASSRTPQAHTDTKDAIQLQPPPLTSRYALSPVTNCVAPPSAPPSSQARAPHATPQPARLGRQPYTAASGLVPDSPGAVARHAALANELFPPSPPVAVAKEAAAPIQQSLAGPGGNHLATTVAAGGYPLQSTPPIASLEIKDSDRDSYCVTESEAEPAESPTRGTRSPRRPAKVRVSHATTSLDSDDQLEQRARLEMAALRLDHDYVPQAATATPHGKPAPSQAAIPSSTSTRTPHPAPTPRRKPAHKPSPSHYITLSSSSSSSSASEPDSASDLDLNQRGRPSCSSSPPERRPCCPGLGLAGKQAVVPDKAGAGKISGSGVMQAPRMAVVATEEVEATPRGPPGGWGGWGQDEEDWDSGILTFEPTPRKLSSIARRTAPTPARRNDATTPPKPSDAAARKSSVVLILSDSEDDSVPLLSSFTPARPSASAAPDATPSTPTARPKATRRKAPSSAPSNPSAEPLLTSAQRMTLPIQLIADLDRTVFRRAWRGLTPLEAGGGPGLPAGVEVRWSKTLRNTAGRATWRKVKTGDKVTHVCHVDLAIKVTDTPSKLRHTLAHELCHIAAWCISGEVKPSHGSAFKAWGARVMQVRPDISVTTTHTYEILYKYRWRCKECSVIFGRHSRSIDQDKVGCGCGGRLAEIDQDGHLMGPRVEKRKSGWQEFMATTMSQVRARNPGMTQPDVMREVSELWAKAKKVADELTKTQEDALTQGMAGLTV